MATLNVPDHCDSTHMAQEARFHGTDCRDACKNPNWAPRGEVLGPFLGAFLDPARCIDVFLPFTALVG